MIDPWLPIDQTWEAERGVRVPRRRVLAVFLAGARCPFRCTFCDLSRFTLDGPTPGGAIPRQLEIALARARTRGEDAAEAADSAPALKLYNASNFFDRRAVPPCDDAAIAALCEGFDRVTVECHPRLLGDRAVRFADRLDARLEIAMGLETVHPEVFPRLSKGMEPEDFTRAVAWAKARGMGTRAFLLVGLPGTPAPEFARWAARSAEYAMHAGADRASLIPLRPGPAPSRSGTEETAPPRLRHLEEALVLALERCAERMIVEADLWDAIALADCDACGPSRIDRLRTANLTQGMPPSPGPCAACGEAPPC